MWLLNTKTLELHYFDGPRDVRAYAILSHTWEDADKEYNFQGIQTTYEKFRDSDEGAIAHAPDKIRKFCLLASDEGFEWAWLDTACIDKTSSAELSEAINSMYAWYEAAARCYAYLYDVPDDDNPFEADSAFRNSKYHKRGWTLQELLASDRVIFLSASWSFLGTKHSLLTPLAERTGIDGDILLRRQPLDTASVAQRMSWAAHRVTTRAEDRAYSLMGIFGVAMPIIYGEGGERAFLRLQKEIIATCPDQSIFAWGSIHPDCDIAYDAIQRAQTFPFAGGYVEPNEIKSLVAETDCNLLARSPSRFANCAGMRRIDAREFFDLTGHTIDYRCTFSADGVTVSLPVSPQYIPLRDHSPVGKVRVMRTVALACSTAASGESDTSIVLLFLSGPPSSLTRWDDSSQELLSDAVGLLAVGEPSPERAGITLSHSTSGYASGTEGWGTFYRGASVRLRKAPELQSIALSASFRFVPADYARRQLRIQHPAASIVTFRPSSELLVVAATPQSPDYVIDLPKWIFHRLESCYGFVFAPSPNESGLTRTTHHALRVACSPADTFYLLFVDTKHTTTLGIAIGGPCCDRSRLPDSLRDSVSLRMFFAPSVLHHGDTRGVEAALRAHELLPEDT